MLMFHQLVTLVTAVMCITYALLSNVIDNILVDIEPILELEYGFTGE